MTDIKVKKITNARVLKELENVCNYSPSCFNISSKYKGKEVKIALLTTGVPQHNDLEKFSEFESFFDDKDVIDRHGHSIVLSGVLKSNNSDLIKGVVPFSQLLFAKVLNNRGEGKNSSVIAAILWAIINNVDVIIIPFCIDSYDEILEKTIKKANNAGCIIVSPIEKNRKNSYPADYEHCIGIRYDPNKKNKEWIVADIGNDNVAISPPKNEAFISLFKNDKYVKVYANEILTTLMGGVIATLIERQRSKGLDVNNGEILKSLFLLSKNY